MEERRRIERLEIKMSPAEKETIERNAKLAHAASVSDFVRSRALRAVAPEGKAVSEAKRAGAEARGGPPAAEAAKLKDPVPEDGAALQKRIMQLIGRGYTTRVATKMAKEEMEQRNG